MLRMRLKALRERHLQEKVEIKKLQIYLRCYYDVIIIKFRKLY